MKCSKIRELGRDLRKFVALTRAERAPVFRHILNCESCVKWLTKNGEKGHAAEMKQLARNDFADPEFVEAVQD